MTKHPAKYSAPIQDVIRARLTDCISIYDPMAGVGTIHGLGPCGSETFGTEIEYEWAIRNPKTTHGSLFDCVALFGYSRFDAICVSPPYGNRMADHHEAKDASRRNTYRHQLGRPLSGGSSAGLQWGEEYRQFHRDAWSEVARTLWPGGKFILNISDHIRKGVVVNVSQFHVDVLLMLGFTLEERIEISTQRQLYGANSKLRVEHENVFVFRKEIAN